MVTSCTFERATFLFLPVRVPSLEQEWGSVSKSNIQTRASSKKLLFVTPPAAVLKASGWVTVLFKASGIWLGDKPLHLSSQES
jgi:hypothetical protein